MRHIGALAIYLCMICVMVLLALWVIGTRVQYVIYMRVGNQAVAAGTGYGRILLGIYTVRAGGKGTGPVQVVRPPRAIWVQVDRGSLQTRWLPRWGANQGNWRAAVQIPVWLLIIVALTVLLLSLLLSIVEPRFYTTQADQLSCSL